MGILELIAERRIYIDSNPIIYLVEQYPRFTNVLSELFGLIDNAQILATTSELTLAEVLVKPFRGQLRDLQQSFEQRLQTSGGLIVAEVLTTAFLVLRISSFKSNSVRVSRNLFAS